MEELHDISLMIKKGIPLIVIESHEEPRVLELCTRLAIKTYQKLYRWTCTDGLVDNASTHMMATPQFSKAGEILTAIRQRSESGIYVLCDFHAYLDDPKVIRQLKDIALYCNKGTTLILVSHALTLPPEVRRQSMRFELNFPSEERIRQLVIEEARTWQQQNKGNKVKTDEKTLSQLVSNLRGLTESDVKHLVRGAIVSDGAISLSDVSAVNQAKFELMNMNNILSFEYDTAQFGDVGGLKTLRHWLAQRKDAFIKGDESLDTPKGIMLLGVQGGGKSLAAKAIAGLWNVPLLRLDVAALYNKFHGETERNLRETLQLADNVSPCVLWMDEIEKALGQSDNEGVSKRVLGTLLTWMAERKSRVFIVATSNDVSQLPPELIRKGRMDELFFVDLPDEDDRMTIANIHLKKRDITLEPSDIKHIAEITEGFTGAEIEQVIVSAIYSAKAKENKVTIDIIQQAVSSTVPISITHQESIAALRYWAQNRAVIAN